MKIIIESPQHTHTGAAISPPTRIRPEPFAEQVEVHAEGRGRGDPRQTDGNIRKTRGGVDFDGLQLFRKPGSCKRNLGDRGASMPATLRQKPDSHGGAAQSAPPPPESGHSRTENHSRAASSAGGRDFPGRRPLELRVEKLLSPWDIGKEMIARAGSATIPPCVFSGLRRIRPAPAGSPDQQGDLALGGPRLEFLA